MGCEARPEPAVIEPVPVQDLVVSDIELMDFGLHNTRVVCMVDTVICELGGQPARQIVCKIVIETRLILPFIRKGLRYLVQRGLETVIGPIVAVDQPPKPLH